MVRGGPGSYRLRLNDSEIEAEIHTLRDGGLLMQASNHFSTACFQTLFIWHLNHIVYHMKIIVTYVEFHS